MHPFASRGNPSPRLLLCGLAAAVLAACGGSGDDPNSVTTDQGVVVGSETASYRQFLGIPYAAAPTGALRWQPPQPAAAWTGERAATQFAPHCPQPATPFGTASTSEDCLYLNVYTPRTGTGPFPVMFWIHGGALIYGESDEYDPTALVNQGVAVVTINYRLGPLGFLSHAALSAEQGGASGNYGLMDQQAALRWVKANIAAFGGDPANVTVFGESAGGLSTHSQLVSPLAAGLFHKAIVQSGAYTLTLPTLAQAEAIGEGFAATAGCADQSADCLRALSLDTVMAHAAQVHGGSQLPTEDGKVLPASYAQAFASGSFNKVPVIEGSNQHEYSMLSAFVTDTVLGREINASEYESTVRTQFGALADALLALYPVTITPAWAYDSLLTDAGFACNGRKAAQLIAAQGQPVYTYEFADADAPMVFDVPARVNGFGAYHASEIQYVWPKQQRIYHGAPFTAAQTDLSNKMVAYWAQFAKTGNPNVAGNPNWPAYTQAGDTYLTLAPSAIAPSTTFGAEHQCAVWTPGA
ncbi:carboxylesterase/lipase family protein [Ottowia sp.]|uniref:carboxylesterase/lipase family protein n=1 Tax=Ottowia sp. TaxID=1898956 RepID=UPI0039E45A84